MYTPAAFQVVDPADVRDLVAAVGSADLITASPRLAATRLPIIWGDDGIIRAHLARANPQWRELPEGAAAMLIIGGPQAYVSPSYYASKAEHGRVVPTWDYAIVHLHGTIRIVDDPPAVRGIVTGLTEQHENRRRHPWRVSDAPDDYVQGMLGAIVGVEVVVTEVEASFKLSQNKSTADIAGVIDGLSASAEAQERHVAELMIKHSRK